MITIGDIVFHTDFETIVGELKIHYGDEHIEKIREIYRKIKNTPCKKNNGNMVVFIRVLTENEEGDEDIVINEFNNNDNTLMFDVCGQDNQFEGLYSIASSEYGELLGYYVDQATINKFSYAQILAHILWELEW